MNGDLSVSAEATSAPTLRKEVTTMVASEEKLLDALAQALAEHRRERRSAPSLHPLRLLERLVDKALLSLERAVRRVVTAVVR